jgi:uncharacterized RDD family membrane protein YckC
VIEETRARTIRSPRARGLQGKPAGFVSRCSADAIDLGVVGVLYFTILTALAAFEYLFLEQPFELPSPDWTVTTVTAWVIAIIYLTSGWASTGRTIGKSTMGLRVVSSRGEGLSPRHAFLRALLCATFGWVLLLWILVSKRRAGIHDVLLRTAVVYDWTTHA